VTFFATTFGVPFTRWAFSKSLIIASVSRVSIAFASVSADGLDCIEVDSDDEVAQPVSVAIQIRRETSDFMFVANVTVQPRAGAGRRFGSSWFMQMRRRYYERVDDSREQKETAAEESHFGRTSGPEENLLE
jgi:hypothetical protein